MLFDEDGVIKRYESPQAILAEFFELRLEYYHRRHVFLLKVGQQQIVSFPSAVEDCPGLPGCCVQ